MRNVTVRNLSDEVHRAIRQRAAAHGRSIEAEMRAILTDAAQPPERVKLGSMLAAAGREIGLTSEEHTALNNRDRHPAEPLTFD
ncbi:Arc family DNA-binding protein [Nocardia sp. NPDC019395]|uniref:FitA-like ribbon-helix-helix domain-containing protein n=1 Tax=Nocardia sp. NPDC019395 TaxID=3154686 RepID=UPI0033F7457C